MPFNLNHYLTIFLLIIKKDFVDILNSYYGHFSDFVNWSSLTFHRILLYFREYSYFVYNLLYQKRLLYLMILNR